MSARVTRRTATRCAGTLLVVGALLLTGCTGNVRPPVVTRTADATPVPRPAPEQTRVPLWTPDATEVRAQAVRQLALRWADGSEVVPEVIDDDDIVDAVAGEHFTPIPEAFPRSVWPLGVTADGTAIVRDDELLAGQGNEEALGFFEIGSEGPVRRFDQSAVEPYSEHEMTSGMSAISVAGQGAAWAETFWTGDGEAEGWRVLAADQRGIVSVVADAREDWSKIHDRAPEGDEVNWTDPTPTVVDDRVFFQVALAGVGSPSVIVSRSLSGGDSRVEGEGAGMPVATAEGVFVTQQTDTGSWIAALGGERVLQLPQAAENAMTLDGAVGSWLLLSSQKVVVAVQPEERRAIAVAREPAQHPEGWWAEPASGGPRFATWPDAGMTDRGSVYLVLDPEAGTAWRLPDRLWGVMFDSADILGWSEAASAAPSMTYVRWTG